jgi:hypothetical protein
LFSNYFFLVGIPLSQVSSSDELTISSEAMLAIGGTVAMTLLVAVANFCIGRGLLSGRRWAWWLAIVTDVFWTCTMMLMAFSVLSDVVGAIQDGSEWWLTLTIVAFLPIVAIATGIAVAWLLLTRRVRNWFRQAHIAWREYKLQRAQWARA